MRLLIIGKLSYNPQVLRWIEWFRAHDVEMLCLHLGTQEELDQIAWPVGIPVEVLFSPDTIRHSRLRKLLTLYTRFKCAIRAHRPSVVFVFCLSTLLFPLSWICRRQGLPLVINIAGSDVNVGARSASNRFCFRFVLQRADAINCLCPEMTKRVASLGRLSADQVTTLYWAGVDRVFFNPVSTKERERARYEYGIRNEDVVLFLGRIARPIAYYEEALQALSELCGRRDLPSWKAVVLHWSANPESLRQIENRVRELGLSSNVLFIRSELTAPQLRLLYGLCDVSLNLMKQDQLGAMILESMALGNLMISTALPQYGILNDQGFRIFWITREHLTENLKPCLLDVITHLRSYQLENVGHNSRLVKSLYRFDDAAAKLHDWMLHKAISVPAHSGRSL